MNNIHKPNPTYYAEENLILEYIYKINQSFSFQSYDYLKDISKKKIIKKIESIILIMLIILYSMMLFDVSKNIKDKKY